MDLNFKKLLSSFWFWAVIGIIVLQFFSLNISSTLPIKNNEEIQAPKEIMNILKRSCYDCHSSEVKEPWYYTVAPISWVVQTHIKNGRKVVNFSKWNSYTQEKQFKIVDKLPKSIIIRMPMPSYLWLHQNATMSADEKKLLTKWSKALKEKIK